MSRLRGAGTPEWTAQPVVYELNTWVWLSGLSRGAGRHVTLGDVPGDAWDAVALPGIDAVWLMGVWERSPAGLAIAWAQPALVAEWRAALPDLAEGDVVGSPYCVRRYVVDSRLGGPEGLARARSELARRGVRLVLDLVPNHTAPDHPWVKIPGCHVEGSAADLARDPAAWLQIGDRVLARGCDPHFPPWSDVVQLDAFSPVMREHVLDAVQSIADQCDGVRCDMAMLLLDDVFASTWAGHVGVALDRPFWVEVRARLDAKHPGFWLCAEAYWDRESDLQEQGFDHTYDKRLYDALRAHDASATRVHLGAGADSLRRGVHFLENHDEERSASVFGSAALALSVLTVTLPGSVLLHEGQLDGRKSRIPVVLGRRPDEPVDAELRAWWQLLLTHAREVRQGAWRPIEAKGWPADQTCERLVAWSWRRDRSGYLVVINLGEGEAHGRLQWAPRHGGEDVVLTDLLAGITYERSVAELLSQGLYVSLPGLAAHLLRWEL